MRSGPRAAGHLAEERDVVSAASNVSPAAPARSLRLVDLLTLFYFGLNTLLLAHPNRPENWVALLAFHLVYLVGVPLAIAWQGKHRLIFLFREWYPLLFLPLMYNELQHLNRVLTSEYFDPLVLRWEEALFGGRPFIDLRRWFPWKILGEVLHLGYFSYYFTIPALFFPLWFSKRISDFRVSMAVVAGTYYFCYLWYVFFPVTGPYWQFPLPDPNTQGWFFPQLANKVIAGASSRGSAFPSSHIAASVSVLGMAARYMKPVHRILIVPVALLCLGTVYGGFHYAIDAVSGLLVGILAARFGPDIVLRFNSQRS